MKVQSALPACALLIIAACGSEPDTPVPDSPQTVPVATGRVLPVEDKPNSPRADGAAAPTMPARLHGRWGLTKADCAAETPSANGLVTITADKVQFYESVAKPDRVRSQSGEAIQGEFAFTGEGMSWTGPMSWSVSGDKLTRVDSEADSRLVYTRC